MQKPKQLFYLGLGCIALLSAACKTVTPANAASNTQPPCWLETPAGDAVDGQIGIARTIALGKYSSAQISQLRAMDALCHSQGITCSEEDLDAALENKQLLGRPLYFADYTSNGYLYTYASFSPASDKTCAPLTCDVSTCNPFWLCQPSGDDKTGLLGISYRATTLFDQYRAAMENGLLQAEYLYGVEITAHKEMQSANTAMGQYRFLAEASLVDTGKREVLPYYMAHQCRSQSTLFTHVVIDRKLDSDNPADHTDLAWMRNPKYKGVDGAVGMVERMVASGLVSDQVKLAIERAAVQLAFEKNSQVAENLVQVTYGKSGLLQISQITENTRVDLKARVLQIHFKQPPGAALQVYVWVAALP